MFSASSLSSLSSQVRSDSSGAGGEAAGGWVSGARVGAGSCSGEATTCSWLKYRKKSEFAQQRLLREGWMEMIKITKMKQ